MEQKNECCETKKDSGLGKGILYGLIPHTGCIAFMLFSIIGATAASSFVRPLLADSRFFYALILLSFAMATLSAMLYLNKRNALSAEGIKGNLKYLSAMYGSTIGVNLLFLFVLFPALVSAVPVQQPPGGACDISGIGSNCSSTGTALASVLLKVDIPCSGHAPLIEDEALKVNGVTGVSFQPPNLFNITYDPSKTSKGAIMSIGVFKTYPATELRGQ
jgi:hypothetical protein